MSTTEHAASIIRRDHQLMSRIQAGSAEAFGELYDHHCDAAWRVAMSVKPDRDAAEEAVQNAFLSIWRSRATYRAHLGVPAAWIMTIVRYRAIDVARARGRDARFRAGDEILETHAGTDDVAGQAVGRAATEHMRTLLDAIPDEQREVIVLAFYGGLSHSEIALRLELPEGTVKGRMRLGLDKLRGSVERQDA